MGTGHPPSRQPLVKVPLVTSRTLVGHHSLGTSFCSNETEEHVSITQLTGPDSQQFILHTIIARLVCSIYDSFLLRRGCLAISFRSHLGPVSYTHLTLPTILLV
eukprot:3420430-Amphidinium_carterae.2